MILKNFEKDEAKYKEYVANYIKSKNMDIFNKIFTLLQRQIVLTMYNKYSFKGKPKSLNVLWIHQFQRIFSEIDGIQQVRSINTQYTMERMTQFLWEGIEHLIVEEASLETDTDLMAEYCQILMLEQRSVNPYFIMDLIDTFGISKEYSEMVFTIARAKVAEFMIDMSSRYAEKWLRQKISEFEPIIQLLCSELYSDLGADNLCRMLIKLSGSTVTFPDVRAEQFIKFDKEFEDDIQHHDLL